MELSDLDFKQTAPKRRRFVLSTMMLKGEITHESSGSAPVRLRCEAKASGGLLAKILPMQALALESQIDGDKRTLSDGKRETEWTDAHVVSVLEIPALVEAAVAKSLAMGETQLLGFRFRDLSRLSQENGGKQAWLLVDGTEGTNRAVLRFEKSDSAGSLAQRPDFDSPAPGDIEISLAINADGRMGIQEISFKVPKLGEIRICAEK